MQPTFPCGCEVAGAVQSVSLDDRSDLVDYGTTLLVLLTLAHLLRLYDFASSLQDVQTLVLLLSALRLCATLEQG